jgi:hypothetical protein
MDGWPANSLRPNHNMDPAIVDSASFGLLWNVAFNSKEQVGDALSCRSTLCWPSEESQAIPPRATDPGVVLCEATHLYPTSGR